MKQILLVDDSASVRQQVRLALTEAGYEVIEANDGLDGLAKLAASPEIGLVISDINMPYMNGLEMVEKLKSDARNAALPVLMLTSEGEPALIERAKKAGVRAWIIKPFRSVMLLAAVRKLLPN